MTAGIPMVLIKALKAGLPGVLYETLEIAYSVPAFVRLAWAWLCHRTDTLYERFNQFQLAGTWLNPIARIPLL